MLMGELIRQNRICFVKDTAIWNSNMLYKYFQYKFNKGHFINQPDFSYKSHFDEIVNSIFK